MDEDIVVGVYWYIRIWYAENNDSRITM